MKIEIVQCDHRESILRLDPDIAYWRCCFCYQTWFLGESRPEEFNGWRIDSMYYTKNAIFQTIEDVVKHHKSIQTYVQSWTPIYTNGIEVVLYKGGVDFIYKEK